MEENERNTYLDDNDDFGLADAQYDPIDRDDDFPPQFEDAYYDDEEEEDRNQGLIVAIVLGFLVLIGLGVYLFGFGGTEQIAGLFEDEPPQTLAVTESTSEEVETEPATVVEEPVATVEETPSTEEVSTSPEVVNESAFYDNIQTISAPTGRSFIVVGSFVDADLAQDYSNKLIAEGVGSRILSPTSRAPLLHRVAIADFDNFSLALERIAEFKSRYGESTWVLKY